MVRCCWQVKKNDGRVWMVVKERPSWGVIHVKRKAIVDVAGGQMNSMVELSDYVNYYSQC